MLNDIFVEGNNKGLSNGPILYQSRRILPQKMLTTKARVERLKPESIRVSRVLSSAALAQLSSNNNIKETMPPKKKPKSKKTKKQTIVTQWDDLDFQSLEQEISKLTKSHNLALQERIKIQTEHDAVRSYYNVTKQQIDSIDEQNKLKDYELDQKKRDDLDENKAYEEKVQQLRYDFEGKVRLAEENKRHDISIENKIYEKNIQHGENGISSAKQELRERQVVNMEEIKQQKLQLEEGRGEVQTSLKIDLEELEEKCNLQEAKIEKELDLKREKDLVEMDDQIKLHLDELKRRHEELHKNTQTLYSNTSTENARSITKLEEECKHVSQSSQELEAKSKKLEEENSRLSGPLSELSSKVGEGTDKCFSFHIVFG